MSFPDLRPRHAWRIALPLLAIALFSPLSPLAHSQTTAGKTVPPDEWTGIYISKQKVGYANTHYVAVTYHDAPAIKVTAQSVIKMQMLGTSVEQEEDTESISDLQNRPLMQTFHNKSHGSVNQLVAVFDYTHHQIHCTIGQGSGATTKDIDIPEGAKLEGDNNDLLDGHKPVVGQKFVTFQLESLTIELQEVTVEVVGQETIRDDSGKQVPTFRVKTSMPLGEGIAWVDAAGHTIKTQINQGALDVVMVAEPKAHALDRAAISPALKATTAGAGKRYTPPADFAVATAIKIAKPIADPRNLKSLKVLIDEIPNEKLLLSDARQQETRVTAHPTPPYAVEVQVVAESVDEAQVPKLPIQDAALAPYLKAAPYLPVDDTNLRKTAMEVRGSGTNPYRIALSLRDWVNNAMTPDASIGVPRSALDIFQRRRGVCRDYATLYTALARAAGVPTRLCSGIVYGDFQGKAGFYYHAWAESWVGKWVAVDPTLFDPSHPVNYVDATHIKFAQGDVTQMFQMVSIVGRLKITVE
ncbi:MAG: transglutaminase domain protein [Chthonomonadales bacterium]|nr:transglutaminase domain protein [Chthonomonadales bacterium]